MANIMRLSMLRLNPFFYTKARSSALHHDLPVCISCRQLRLGNLHELTTESSAIRRPFSSISTKTSLVPRKTVYYKKKKKLKKPAEVHKKLINVLGIYEKCLSSVAAHGEKYTSNHAVHQVENLNNGITGTSPQKFNLSSDREKEVRLLQKLEIQLSKENSVKDNGKKKKKKKSVINSKNSDRNQVGYIVDMNSVVDSMFSRLKTHNLVCNQAEPSWDTSLDTFKKQMKNFTSTEKTEEPENTLYDQLVNSTETLEGTLVSNHANMDVLSHGGLIKDNSKELRSEPSEQQQPKLDSGNTTCNNIIHKQARETKKLSKPPKLKQAKSKVKSPLSKLSPLSAFEGKEVADNISIEDFIEPIQESLIDQVNPGIHNEHEDILEIENEIEDQVHIHRGDLTQAVKDFGKANRFEHVDRSALGRSHNFVEDMKSYIDACIHAGMLNKAHTTLCYFNRYSKTTKNGKKFNITTANIDLYNLLLRGWAKKHNVDKMRRLFSLLREDGLKPNMESFASVLECLGRMRHFDFEMAAKCIDDMDKFGLDIKDIMNECVFQKDERHFVMKAIKEVCPGYVPNEPPSNTRYSCSLVDHLNEVHEFEENPYAGIVSTESLKERAEQQLYWERQLFLTVDSVEKLPPPNDKTIEMREKLKNVQDEWKKNLLVSFKRKVDALNRDHVLNLYPYTKVFKPEEYVELILQEIQLLATQATSFSPNVSMLWKRLGTRAHKKYIIQDKINNQHAEKVAKVYSHFSKSYNGPLRNHRETWQEIIKQHEDGPTLDLPEKQWPWHIKRSLGRFLYDIILYDTKLDRNILKTSEEKHMIPAFYTVFRKNHRVLQMTEEVKPHPTLVTLFKEAGWKDLNFEVQDLPMLVPSVPWSSVTYGGHLLGSTQLVRANEMTQQQMTVLKELPKNKMNPVLDSLNILSACPWKINKPVLDLIIEIFNNKGRKELDIPPPVSECPPIPKITLDMSNAEKSQLYRERVRLKQQQSEMYSLWCNELYKLSIANMFRDEIFWFPHNMDFRGRVYPCPPHFNHLGSDVTRSILLFAKGKPLGEKGLDWLKTHLINLTGFKKRSSNKERLAYANEVMTDIMDSAENPMMCDWWKDSDEPWQTLACCMEIRNALLSENPVEYVSHFPVHQDGSCNGLQHYAALGRDQSGAESVNLHPFESPQDVYSDVAEMVEKLRTADAKDGNQIAEVLDGFIKRKVIKQTVMTTVYGVTRYGAKFQILKQLRDIPDFPQEHAWAASAYLTEKTFLSLQQMFTATKEIQDWFTACAQLISTVKSKPVEWVTPLGMPVIQPYHKMVAANKSGMQALNRNNMFEKPNSMKQKNAMPPNFIHSLDSTHMMLTSLHCINAGITFVSVHDCFWTHACDVNTMNQIIREQFVALHSEPILEDLSEYMQQCVGGREGENKDMPQDLSQSMKFLNSVLGMVPNRGEFDLNNVLKSTYFFS